MKRAVLVTGASGGIGRATVSTLADLGFAVVGAVRTDAQAASLEPSVQCVRLDLSDPSSVERAAAEVRALGLPLHAVVNNAGMSHAGAVEDLPLDVIREVLEVDLLGPLALTRALLPELRAAGGRIVNVGSGEGFLATPLNAPYCMAKHALEALSVSLRLELAPSGIPVSVVCPGQTETAILTRARAQFADLAGRTSEPYRSLLEPRGRMALRVGAPPECVAAAVGRAVTSRRPKSRYFVGADSRGAFLLGRVLPEPLRKLAYRVLLGFQ